MNSLLQLSEAVKTQEKSFSYDLYKLPDISTPAILSQEEEVIYNKLQELKAYTSEKRVVGLIQEIVDQIRAYERRMVAEDEAGRIYKL